MSLEKIPDVLRALAEEHVDYVLIGAVAMMAMVWFGQPRTWISSCGLTQTIWAVTGGSARSDDPAMTRLH